MPLRDRALVAALAVLFVASSALALGPTITTAPVGVATPAPTAAGGRRYVEGVLGQATGANPFGARSAADRMLDALVFRGLVRLGPNQTIVGDLASSWSTDPSGGQWTFHLRPGLRWQDGQPLTADDVAFTISALADPAYTGPDGASWREVTASVVDPLTVTLQLATPLGGFLQAATQPIAPKHLLGQVAPAALADDSFGLHPVGSGPFRLVSIDSHEAMLDAAGVPPSPSLAPSTSEAPSTPPAAATSSGPPPSAPASAGPSASSEPAPAATSASSAPAGSASRSAPATPAGPSFVPVGSPGASSLFPVPHLAGIELRFFDDAASLRAAWNRGDLDAASELSPSDAAALAATPGARALRYPSSTLMAVVLNLRAGTTTFSDPVVRRALLEAVDRDALLADPLDGFGSIATSLIPPWSTVFDASASPEVPFDPTAAKAALVKAGWKQSGDSWIPKGASAPVQLSIVSPDAASNPVAFGIAEAVAASWRSIGLDARHQALPAASLLADRIEPGQFEAAVLPLVVGLDPDLYPLLASTQTRTGGANIAGLQDAALDKLLEAARAPGTDADRLAAYRALEQRLAASEYILPLAFRDDVVVVRDTVQDVVPRPIGDPGDRFWDVLAWRLAESPTPS
jgi:ABC-type transport system substrate-binding protein